MDSPPQGGATDRRSAVEQFESTFARYCGVSHCVSVANGTDALELGLRALGVQAEDEVITVGNAGGYTTAACQAIGAAPVYIDVVPSTCQLSAESVEEAVTCKTRAIVVRVGSLAFIGAGATVIPGTTIGHDATIGAGASVLRDVPDGASAWGVPARIMRSNQ